MVCLDKEEYKEIISEIVPSGPSKIGVCLDKEET